MLSVRDVSCELQLASQTLLLMSDSSGNSSTLSANKRGDACSPNMAGQEVQAL